MSSTPSAGEDPVRLTRVLTRSPAAANRWLTALIAARHLRRGSSQESMR